MFWKLCFLALCVAPQSLFAAPLSEEPGRVIYQVYVRAFYDGSLVPDGEGDFSGLTAKADYFEETGIDTLLLMPIFSSTGDMGYIPRDYFQLDSGYGSEADFKQFLDAMHRRGIKVILDAPVNHISYDSEWFKRGSQRNCDPNDVAHDPQDPDNVYCDFFYFVQDPCHSWPYSNWHKPWHWNSTDCRAVWFERPGRNLAYHRPELHYATFFSVMPDLKFWDYDQHRFHEPVVEKIQEYFDKWTALGVDGFRIDAAKHFVEGYDNNSNPLEPKNLELLQRWLEGARRVNPDVSFVGEIWAPHDQFEPYLNGALDMVLDFPFMEAVRSSAGDRYGERFKNVLKHFEATQGHIKPGARVVFAGNHDVSRMMTEWNNDQEKWRLALFLSVTTPHTPLLYYGEEIGMHGKVKRPNGTSNEEYVRTINAFSWHGRDRSVGFPGGLEPVTQPAENFAERNLETDRQSRRSSWGFVRDLLALRKAFGVTPATRLIVRDDLFGHVIGWTMRQDGDPKSDGTYCRTTLVNFHAQETYTVPAVAAAHCSGTPRLVFGEGAVLKGNDLTLSPGGKALLDFGV